MITSLHNPRVKAAIKLRDARQRHKQRRIIIDGARELFRAVQAGIEIVEVFVCEDLCQSHDCRRLLEALATPVLLRQPHELVQVSAPVFEKLAYGARADGVVGVAQTPSNSLATWTFPPRPLVAVLEGVEKPGNIGAVLRSADAAGVSALIVADGGTDLYNPNAIRASLGTIFTVPVFDVPSAAARMWFEDHGLTIYAAWVDAELEYTSADFTKPCAIILGNEAKGLSAQWQSKAARPEATTVERGEDATITPIRIPMLGETDSLNVSVAAAILFYEAVRQRRSTNPE